MLQIRSSIKRRSLLETMRDCRGDPTFWFPGKAESTPAVVSDRYIMTTLDVRMLPFIATSLVRYSSMTTRC